MTWIKKILERIMNFIQRITTSNVRVNSAIPAPPVEFAVSIISSSQIDLTWIDDSYNETGFEIHHSTTSPSSGFSLLYTTTADEESYSHTGLTEGTTHYYKLRAVNANGESDYVESSGTTLVPAPSNLDASTVSSTQINLTWDDNSSTETGFEIFRSEDGATFTLIHTTAANVESYNNTGLTANTTYYYRVRAVGVTIRSEPSNIDSSTTSPALNAPSDLTATAVSSSQIDLTWVDNSSNETGFEIERSTTSGSGFSLINTTAANATTYSDTGRTASTTYYYRIRAINAEGSTAYTSEAIATTTAAGTIPDAPTNLITTGVGNTNITLAWTDNSSNETGFQIERSVDTNTSFSLLTTTAAGVNTYDDTGLDEGRRYHYRVRATNGSGNSAYTNQAQEFTTWTTDVAYVNKGTANSSSASTLSLAYPAGITAGKMLIAVIGTKANKTVVDTPAGWITGSGEGFIDYNAGQGGGQGSVTGHVFLKIATGSETGSESFTVYNTPNVAYGMIYQFQGDSNAFWSYAISGASHRIPNTSSYSATSWNRLNMIKGDVMFVVSLINYVSTWSAQALTHSGTTIAEVTEEITDSSTTTGNDISHVASLYRCNSNTSNTQKAVFTMTNGTAPTSNAPIGITIFIRLRNARVSPTYNPHIRTWRGADIVHTTASQSQDTLSLFDGLRISKEGPDSNTTRYSIATFNGRSCMKFVADFTTGINRRTELSGNWSPTLPLGTQILDEIRYETDSTATEALGEFVIAQHHTGSAPGGPWPANSPLFYFGWTYNGQSGFDNLPGTSPGAEFQFVNNCRVSGGYIRNRYPDIVWGPNTVYIVRYFWRFDIASGNPISKVWVATAPVGTPITSDDYVLLYESDTYPTAAETDAEMGSNSLCAGTTKFPIYHHMINTEAQRAASVAAGHTGVTIFIPCRKQIIQMPGDSFYFTDYTNNSASFFNLVSTASE